MMAHVEKDFEIVNRAGLLAERSSRCQGNSR